MLGVMQNTLESKSLTEEMALSAKYDELSSAPDNCPLTSHMCCGTPIPTQGNEFKKKKPSPIPIYSKKVVTEKLQLQICVICNHYVWLLGVCAVSSAWEDCHFFLWVLLASSSLTYCPELTVYTLSLKHNY